MAKIKYIRVSTNHQNTARQEVDIANYDKVFIDHVSGKSTDRPQLKAMLDYVREGDVVVVESYSRMSRSTHDLLDIVDRLEKKSVAFISQKEQIDTSTPHGKLMMTVFAGLAQFEREVMLERQAEGIAIAVAEGKMGRPRTQKPPNFNKIHSDWKNGLYTATMAMRLLGLTKTKFYQMSKEREQELMSSM